MPEITTGRTDKLIDKLVLHVISRGLLTAYNFLFGSPIPRLMFFSRVTQLIYLVLVSLFEPVNEL